MIAPFRMAETSPEVSKFFLALQAHLRCPLQA